MDRIKEIQNNFDDFNNHIGGNKRSLIFRMMSIISINTTSPILKERMVINDDIINIIKFEISEKIFFMYFNSDTDSIECIDIDSGQSLFSVLDTPSTLNALNVINNLKK